MGREAEKTGVGKIIYEDGRDYCCSDCKKNVGRFKSRNAALDAGWAVSKDYKKCYCPDCAPKHRNGGAKRANVRSLKAVNGLSVGFEQMQIKIV